MTDECTFQVKGRETDPKQRQIISVMPKIADNCEGVGEIMSPQFDTTTILRRLGAFFTQSRVQKLTRDLATKLQSLIVEHENITSQSISERATSDPAIFKDSRSDEQILQLVPLPLICNMLEEYMREMLLLFLNPDQTDIEVSSIYENSERSSQLFEETVDLHTKTMVHQVMDNKCMASVLPSERSQGRKVQSLGRASPLNESEEKKLNNNSVPLADTKRRWKWFKVKPSLLLIKGPYVKTCQYMYICNMFYAL